MTLRRTVSRYRTAAVTIALVTATLAVLALVGPPGGEERAGRLRSLRTMLERMGVPVVDRDVPTTGTFLLLHDLRSRDQSEALLDWVRDGGRLVIADPASPTLASAGIVPAGMVGGLTTRRDLRADCPAPVAAAPTIAVRPGEALWETTQAPWLPCFRTETGAFVTQRQLGDGSVTALGGPSPLENDGIALAGNAVLAWSLLGAPDEPVGVGPPVPPGTTPASAGPWTLLPSAARALLLQLGVAALLVVLVRARRLGPPVEEHLPAPIPGSALVTATGDLYRRGGARQHASAHLRDRIRVLARRRLAMPGDSTDEELARALTAAGGPGADLRSLLAGAPPPGDAGLVEEGRRAAALEAELRGEG